MPIRKIAPIAPSITPCHPGRICSTLLDGEQLLTGLGLVRLTKNLDGAKSIFIVTGTAGMSPVD
jgi:hypothetical protein